MARYIYCSVIISIILGSYYVESTEFVPVYMWGTEKIPEHVSALHRVSQDSFKDTILEYLKENPYFIVFAEHTLSPEDFAQHNSKGESAFPKIQNLKNQGNYINYKPYVQNPIGAIKQVKPVTQTSISSILNSLDVPKDNIWIINLDDARDDETRFHMLKRHDDDITQIYEAIVKQHDTVLAVYTANHTAWVAPEGVTHNQRNLLATVEPNTESGNKSIVYKANQVLIYLTENGTYFCNNTRVNITQEFSLTSNATTTNASAPILANLQKDGTNISLILTAQSGYWYLRNVSVNDVALHGFSDAFAPLTFSYHCGAFFLKQTNNSDVNLTLPGFQIQAYGNTSKFGDAYDCVGFTSVPIWSGLFVTAIMLFIVTLGLTMMMEIKTMDRFDDPKGKTITITASE